jgi:nucleoside diphosphate kinase
MEFTVDEQKPFWNSVVKTKQNTLVVVAVAVGVAVVVVVVVFGGATTNCFSN